MVHSLIAEPPAKQTHNPPENHRVKVNDRGVAKNGAAASTASKAPTV
jgi:hypothetical protein